MRGSPDATPTRIADRPASPYDELAQLADPEPEFSDSGRDTRWSGRRGGDQEEPDTWSPPDHRARGRSSLTGLSGLRLHPEAARALAREQQKVRALLEAPAVVERLGLPQQRVKQALSGEKRLHELTGTPQFANSLMKANLIDVVAENPWLLEKAGIDPKTISALLALRPPELSEQLSLSFSLPDDPDRLKLRNVSVEPDGIRTDLGGSGLEPGG